MSLTINSFKNMDFFKILEKLKELNPKFDYKSNSIIADEFKIKFIPFENIIVISSLKNGESIKFANKTLDCLSGLVSDDVLFNLMENYDIEELFKKKSINEELFENLKKLKNDSDTYVSKLMEKYEDGLTVEERNKIKEEIKSYNDIVELCDNSMLVKTGETSVEYEYKKFRFGIIISEPAAAMRLNKAFLLQAFAFNLDNNFLTKTYYITYEEAVNLGFDPESMKNILNSQVTGSMEYIKAFGISEEIRYLDLVKEFNRLEYYHKKGVIYDSTYNYVKENLYYDKEEIIEESVNKKELVKEEVFDLLKSKNGVDKFLSSAKFITSGKKSYSIITEYYYVQYNYKGCKIDIDWDLLVCSIKNLLLTVSIDIDKITDLYYKDVIKLGFPEKEIIDSIYKTIINKLNFWLEDLDEIRKNILITGFLSNSKIMGFLYENKNHKEYKKVMNLLSLLAHKDDELYESDDSDSISEKQNNLKILDEVKELFQTSDGIDKFLSSAKLVENNNISSILLLDNIKYIYKNTEIRINFISLGNPDLSYKNIFFTNLRIDCKDSMFFVDLYYKEAIRLGFDKQKIVDYIYLKLINDIQYDSYYKSSNEFEKIKKISYILNNQEIINFLNDNKNNVDYERFMNIIKSLDYKKATNIINPVDGKDVLYEDKNNSKENDILDEVAELLKTEEGIDKFLSSAKKVDAPVEDEVSDEESIQYIYNEQIIVFTVYYIDYTKIYVKINNKKSLVLSYNDAVKLGFDKQNIADYICMKIIGDIQHDRYYKSLNEFEKIKKISYILNNQEIINFLNDNKNNVWYEKFMNIIKSLDYKKATNIINPVDSKDVLYEDKNNSKVNNIPDEVVKLLNSKKGIDKFLSEAEFDYKTTTKVDYKYKNKTVSIGIDLYNLARDFDKVILRVGHTNRSNSICPVYYKDAIRLGFRKKIVIDHLFEKFFKLYNWYIQNKCYSELINDKVIKFLNDNKTHKDYRKAMRIIKHPYRGEGTIYESKDENSFNSYPFADYDKTKDVITLLSSKDGIDKFMSEAEILKRYNYGNLYLYKNNIYEFQISPKYDNPTKISLNDFYSITGGRLGLPYTEVIKLGFDESFVVDMVYVAILVNIELYKHSIELLNDEVIKFVLAHKNHKHYKTVKNYLEKVIVSYGDELLESKNETTDDTLKELHEFNTFMESSFGIDKFLSKAKLLKSNEEEIIYQYKNGIYHLYICPWWYDYKMKNLFIIEIGYERYSENLELKYTNNLFMDYRNAIKLGFNKDKVIKTIYDKIYRFLDDLIKKSKKIEIYNENELNEIMNFLEMSIDYSKEYQEAYNIVKNYITGKSPEEDEMIFESKRK